MNTTESRIIPLARKFFRLFLDGKKSKARLVLSDAEGEMERIAVVVEALQQSGWSFTFATWIQSWHTSDSIPSTVQPITEASTSVCFEEKRNNHTRLGRTYRTGDLVLVDGHLFGKVVNAAYGSDIPSNCLIAIHVDGDELDCVVSRHRLAFL